MKEYFTKQIQNYCNLTFKNKIFRKNQHQPLIRINHIHQQSPKNKQQKISLKKVNSQQVMKSRKELNNFQKTRQTKIVQSQTSIKIDRLKNSHNLAQSTKKSQNVSFGLARFKELSLSKSLPKDLNRRGKQKRNLIQELKQYKKKKENGKNLSPHRVQIFPRTQQISPQYNSPLRQVVIKNICVTPQAKRHYQQQNYCTYTPNPQQVYANNYQPINNQSPSPFKYYENNFNNYFEPLSNRKISSQRLIKLSVPYQTSQLHQSFATKQDKLAKQIQNDYDMDYQIKLDLISSISKQKNENSQFKAFQSLRSTMISPSQMKQNINQNSINFSTPAIAFKKECDNSYEPKSRLQNPICELDQKTFINRKQRFKSIVSVHSQHDSQEQKMKESIVLQTHNNVKCSGKMTKLI